MAANNVALKFNDISPGQGIRSRYPAHFTWIPPAVGWTHDNGHHGHRNRQVVPDDYHRDAARQAELFFKWLKQHLRIKAFLGTSENAVQTQIWTALIAYLLLAYLNFLSKVSLTLLEIMRLLQFNWFDRSSIFAILRAGPKRPVLKAESPFSPVIPRRKARA